MFSPELCSVRQAVEAAQKAGKSPDTFYCLELLQETGILTVPGADSVLANYLSLPSGCILLGGRVTNLQLRSVGMYVPSGQGLSAAAEHLRLLWALLHSVPLKCCMDVCCCIPVQVASA